MTWYKDGTANVSNGSTTVNGSGTEWVANVKIGQEFRLEGGSVGYEITAIVSDTQMTISPAYLGSTQSGQAYSVAPLVGFYQRAYDALEAAIAQWETQISKVLAGRFGSGSAAEPGIAFEAETDLGWFRKAAGQLGAAVGGVQRVLISASAMQVDVPVTGTAVQASATDVASGRLARADFAYSPGNVLGAVSQAGGVPTGAVVERGSNANGEYVRFADGTQICTHTINLGSRIAYGTGTSGDPYRTDLLDWTFAASFAAQPSVEATSITNTNQSAARYNTCNMRNVFNTYAQSIQACAGSSGTTDVDVLVSLTAHGRWF